MATVMLTGASGFLGVHTTKALLDAGHEVRAMVRAPARLEEHLRPVGLAGDDRVTAVEGDMIDEKSVRLAVEGCDAVVHAAATFSFRRKDTARMKRENAVGTRTVLGAGADAGCARLVQVSSTVALARPGGVVVDHTSPLGTGPGPYSASKVASEQVAREMQASGAPVTIVNPGSVLGPHDPYLGENNRYVRLILRGLLPAWPRGSAPYVDVRDVAAVLTAAVAHEPGGRYLVPGHDVTLPHAELRRVTGRRLPAAIVPAWAAGAASVPGDLTGWSWLPDGLEGTKVVGFANTVDSSRTTEDLGVTARPFAETLRDTIRWLVDAGHISRRQAGRALTG
jgi:nucleoside-diphosphate-sugar epimerase